MKVDDIDPQGKVSLSLAGEYANVASDEGDAPRAPRPPRDGGDRGGRDHDRGSRDDRGARDHDRGSRDDRGGRDDRDRSRDSGSSNKPSSSFEASFEAELAGEIGDLGPGGPSFSESDGGGRRSPRPRRR